MGKWQLEKSLHDFGYTNQEKSDTLSLLRAVGLCGDRAAVPSDRHTIRNDKQEKYIRLVRLLPAPTPVEALVRIYFELVNWQYDLIDEEMFREHLRDWWKVSYSNLKKDFASIATDMLVFPALLFQVLAQALLLQAPKDPVINNILNMPDMTYHDLSVEYNNAGTALLGMFDKDLSTVITVQAGLLNASFLKSSGKVVEAWHALGATIRDSQELPVHSGRNIYEVALYDTKKERRRLIVMTHKIRVILHVWDAHMAVVLGRPMTTVLNLDSFNKSIRNEAARTELLSHWKTEDEPPRPFDVIMAGYMVAHRYFVDIHNLQHYVEKIANVKHIHAEISQSLELLPSWCRLQNPNTKFDEACRWLPAAREVLYSLVHLVLLALHRPLIFSSFESRVEALKAGGSILDAQERLFQMSGPHQEHLFTPVYHSFDAIVLMAAICLIFPNEDRERHAQSIEAIAKGIERLELIGRSNHMAQAAHGVAVSLYHRLMRQSGGAVSAEDSSDPLPSSAELIPDSRAPPTVPALSSAAFKTALPPQPIHDLFDDHLSSTQMTESNMQDNTNSDSLFVTDLDDWGFEGDFSDESFWGMLNGFNAAT